MESMLLFILMYFGAVLVWKRLAGKVSGASSREEGMGSFFFMLIAGSVPLFFVMGAIREEFPAVRHDLFLAFIVTLVCLSIFLWALFRIHDWVVGNERNGHNNEK